MTTVDTIILFVYFIFILGFGSFFAKYTKNTKDFFFSGQRFSWWMIAMSCVAMVVGSYSFVKYSEKAFKYGFSSTQTYLNDWIFLPLWLFGWLPIIYYSKIQSIPEYMEKRFGKSSRIIITVLLMVYMIGYVGINLYTMGIALNALVPWDIFLWAVVVALISGIYVTFGGQTSVIMTDLLQGGILIIAGILLFVVGIFYIGGFSEFFHALPPSHRTAFSPFNHPPDFNAVGIFWQDGIANSAAFYFINQGLIMRFLAVRSEKEGKRAILFVILVLMPITAIAVSSAGWVGQALVQKNMIPTFEANDAFVAVSAHLLGAGSKFHFPGLFGFVIAALIAALMSTLDTLINAISAIFINDIYRPYIAKHRTDKHYLNMARISSIATAVIGIGLVPVYMQFGSIYNAHGTFTAAITPPLVVVVLMGFLWKRYSKSAANWTMIGGIILIGFSMIFPEIIKPFSHGIKPAGEYAKSYMYIRALWGIIASVGVGIIVTIFTKPEPYEKLVGLVVGTKIKAMRLFKGGEPNLEKGERVIVNIKVTESEENGVVISKSLATKLRAKANDIVYICDTRWYLGGLKSVHTRVLKIEEGDGKNDTIVELPRSLFEEGGFDENRKVYIEKVF